MNASLIAQEPNSCGARMKKVRNIKKLTKCWWCVSFAMHFLSNIKYTASSYLLFIVQFKAYFQVGKLSRYPQYSHQQMADQSVSYSDRLNGYVWVNRNNQTDKYHQLKCSLFWKEAACLFFNQRVFTVLFIDGGIPQK